MLCILTGRGRYSGGVERPAESDGSPPPEIEIVGPRRLQRGDTAGGDTDEVDVLVYRHDGWTADGEPRYVRDRQFTRARAD